jgi:pyruvate kinase
MSKRGLREGVSRTQIICTLGPATRQPEIVRRMIEEGMDYARLNFSHGTAQGHTESAQMVREIARQAGRSVKVIQDLQGPKLRIGKLSHPLHVSSGNKVTLTRTVTGPSDIPVPKPEILTWINVGDRIFLDDGAVELEALDLAEGRVNCMVRIGGRVDSRSGIQLPSSNPSLPVLSQKDLADIKIGREIGVDIVAQSMVRSHADIEKLKAYLGETVPIVAKIEAAEALQDLKEIAKRAWGLMVARGDLGTSIPRAQVPLRQKEILAICRENSRFGIVATEMLLSMVTNERPTRAEVSDVATAVFDGANAVMLSEETAIGAHPAEAVREMREVIKTVEASRWYRPSGLGVI